jgi:hypothetical protein
MGDAEERADEVELSFVFEEVAACGGTAVGWVDVFGCSLCFATPA